MNVLKRKRKRERGRGRGGERDRERQRQRETERQRPILELLSTYHNIYELREKFSNIVSQNIWGMVIV